MTKPTKPAVRLDRLDGWGRRWVLIDQERRLKCWRWIEAQKRAEPNGPQMTLNMALSKLLASAIDRIEE